MAWRSLDSISTDRGRSSTARPASQGDVRPAPELPLVQIAASLRARPTRIRLDGQSLSLAEVVAAGVARPRIAIAEDPALRARMDASYSAMMRDVSEGRSVYGCNTAYGGRSRVAPTSGSPKQRVANAVELSEALVFLDVGVGQPLPREIIRAAILVRLNMLLQGVSGIRPEQLEPLRQMLEAGLTPIVAEHGGLGASGDLIHNQRVVSVARGLPGAKAWAPDGRVHESAELLAAFGIAPLELEPKAGLAFVNGDNFSTAMAAIVAYQLCHYFLLSVAASALTLEVLQGTDRSFHPLLAAVRRHPGQRESADLYRLLLDGSQLARHEPDGHRPGRVGSQVQDVYSLRCLAQFEGVFVEKLKQSFETIEINANSASDNPLWVPDELAMTGETPWQWVSGGNFLALHMAEVLDGLRKITTQLIKKQDRHLARLVDEADNAGLPANLSKPGATATGCAFKGIQILSGMLEVQSMQLANPVTTLFGIHEERNQDLTSHATTSGHLALRNLELLRYSLAANLLALAQAVDLRGGAERLAPRTRPLYAFVRASSAVVREERPLHADLEHLARRLDDESTRDALMQSIFSGDGSCAAASAVRRAVHD